MKPLISVIVPVYNRGPRIGVTLDSVLAQTLPRETYELIVIDDGSTDGTADFIDDKYNDTAQVRVIRQKNSGVAAARNRGLAEASGEFIAYLDHDDYWLPTKLEAQLAAFKATPEAAVVYCLWDEVDEQDNPLSEEQQIIQLDNWQPTTGNVYLALIPRNFIVSMSVPMIRVAALRAVGGFDPRTVPCDDWDLWLRLARRYTFGCVPRRLVLYTRHPQQQSNVAGDMHRGEQNTLIKQWPYLLGQPRKLWAVLSLSGFLKTAPLYYAAKQELFTAHRMRALGLLCRAFIRHPLALLSPQWLYLLKRVVVSDRTPF